MYFRDFIGTSYFTIGIQLTQPCHNSKYYGDYYIIGPVTVSSGGRLLLTNEMDMPTTPLTVTLSNPITVENNGLVVLDAYAKDHNRNIATTYKMVDGCDGPAIIVEEGGTLAVNAAKFEGTGIEVDGGTVIVNKGTYYGSLTPFSSLAASVTGDGLFTNNLDTYTDVETTDEPVIEVKSGTLELRGGEYTAGTSVPIKAAAEPNLTPGMPLCWIL